MNKYGFTKNSKIFAIISLVLVVCGIVGLIINGGLNYGIDFTGGSTIQLSTKTDSYSLPEGVTTDEIENVVKEALGGAEVQAQSLGTESIIIKTVELGGYIKEEAPEAEAPETEVPETEAVPGEEAVTEETAPEATEEVVAEETAPEATEEVAAEETAPEATEEVAAEEAAPEATEEVVAEETAPEATEEVVAEETAPEDMTDVEKVFAAIEAKYNISIPEEERNVTTISASTSKKILTDSLYAILIAVVLMLLYITVRFEFLSGVSAVAGLVHNIVIMIGVYALFKLPVNNSFVAAVLTIVGYSINNTIVIFDRVRENVKKEKSLSYEEIADKSVSQSLARTINSSITTLMTIGMLYIMGVNSIREFALPIIIGIVAGTYSSIFLCAPLWVKMKEGWAKMRRKKVASKKAPGKKKYVGAPKKEDK